MARMTSEAGAKPRRWVMWSGFAAVLLVIAGFVIAGAIHERNTERDLEDRLYCSMEGVDLFDQAPSGRDCAEVWN